MATASPSNSSTAATASSPQLLKVWKCFGGEQRRYSHASTSVKTSMHFQIYLPPLAASSSVPVLYCLAGLTCTDETFLWKSGAQRYAAEHNIALVTPDTSPRTGGTLLNETASWDFGAGAGFYLTATKSPYDQHYNMYQYVLEELPAVIATLGLPLDLTRASVLGHSMGGLGALNLFLKNPSRFASVSAFAPIVNPSKVPWGIKAFSGYLGDSEEEKKIQWSQWDPTELVARSNSSADIPSSPPRLPPVPVKIDLGSADEFLAAGQVDIQPFLAAAATSTSFDIQFTMREGYDHGYFFIQTFVGEHIAFHAKHLAKA